MADLMLVALAVCCLWGGVTPFVWWGIVFMGGRILTIPTDADTIILVAAEPEIIVDVDVDEP